MNVKTEHRKYIMAMIAGALVTGVLAIAIMYNVSTVNNFNDSKQEVLVYTYDICNDKLEHYVNELDDCLYREKRLLSIEEQQYETVIKLNKKYIRLLNKYNDLKRELEARDKLLLDSTNIE
jgi:hypothetical protein